MRIGFTGSSEGITSLQRDKLRELLSAWVSERGEHVAHHGDCVGADAEFHALALELGLRVVVHPPTNPKKRAFCRGFAERRPEKPYLDRNHDIVDSAERVIACSGTMAEVQRSGTWATVRYARKVGKPVWVVFLDGSVGAPSLGQGESS